MSDWKKQVADFRAGLKVEESSLSTSFIRFGFFGTVGDGKSVTSGILAIGITPEGPIGWIDGEGRRSGYAIDTVADLAAKHYGKPKQSFVDRFKVVHVEPPFNPLVGVAAIETLEAQGCKTIIADFCSQIWDSEGGYMDMREDEIEKMVGANSNTTRQKVASSAAAHVKPWTHGKFVSKVNSCKCNLILVFQAKQKWNPKANKPDEFTSPIQESGLTRTALAVGRVERNASGEGGFCVFNGPSNQGTKHTHPSLLALLPKPEEQFHFRHAEAILKWSHPSGIAPNGQPTNGTKPVKTRLWEALPPRAKQGQGPVEKAGAATVWLREKGLIGEKEAWSTLTETGMEAVLTTLPNIL